MKTLQEMTLEELASRYQEKIGYDPIQDDPTTTREDLIQTLTEFQLERAYLEGYATGHEDAMEGVQPMSRYPFMESKMSDGASFDEAEKAWLGYYDGHAMELNMQDALRFKDLQFDSQSKPVMVLNSNEQNSKVSK